MLIWATSLLLLDYSCISHKWFVPVLLPLKLWLFFSHSALLLNNPALLIFHFAKKILITKIAASTMFQRNAYKQQCNYMQKYSLVAITRGEEYINPNDSHRSITTLQFKHVIPICLIHSHEKNINSLQFYAILVIW